MKIIYCGFFKTASRSIGDFIDNISGYKHYVGRTLDAHSHPTEISFGPDTFRLNINDMCSSIHAGTVENPEVYEYLKNHDDMIARDFPYFGMYKHINENFENSKFIICIRDTEAFLKSYVKHVHGQLGSAIRKSNFSVLGVDGPIDNQHYDKLKMTYEIHNQRVLNYFKDKPGKLLVLKFEDIGTEKFEKDILDFLELENPNNIKMKHIA